MSYIMISNGTIVNQLLFKTNSILFQATDSFDSQGISIETAPQRFVLLYLHINQLKPLHSFIPQCIEVECHSLLNPNRIACEYHSTSIAL